MNKYLAIGLVVAGDASLIGYINVDAVTGDVKILLTVP
jgi:hypothetical protein